MVRVDGETASIQAYGHATPRATAMADGPGAGELLFADETGVLLRPIHGQDRLILAPRDDREWEDMALSSDNKSLLLSWAHGVAVVDLVEREIVGELEMRARGRLARWDEQGSLLVWPFSFMGQPRGEILPLGRDRSLAVVEATSNLRATLEGERLVLELDDSGLSQPMAR
jgi:hypothetical protein